ncbi:MAG: hypothetical protein H6659_00725 [Ardenticatenaceae bacterium]|nr:hypothetical protein [Ardenticatenaceae bacterium]
MSKSSEDTKWYAYTSSTQTMRTWARRIDTFAEVPPVFQAAFPPHSPHDPFPSTIYLPEDRLSKAHLRNDQLVCLFADHFVLLERQRDEIVTRAADFADVLYIQRGLVLLNSWLKIRTSAEEFELPFNTTVEYLFDPLVDTLRRAGMGVSAYGEVPGAKMKPDLSRFDFLETVNYKFMNYGRSSIHSSDKILGLIYQPDETLHSLRFFNRVVYHQYKTAHLTVLTDHELVLIQEAKAIRNNFDSSYGGVFTYIPRRQIQEVSFTPPPQAADAAWQMDVVLASDVHLAVEFSASNESLPSFQALWN